MNNTKLSHFEIPPSIIDQICLPGVQCQESVVYDKSGNVIETHEHSGDFKE